MNFINPFHLFPFNLSLLVIVVNAWLGLRSGWIQLHPNESDDLFDQEVIWFRLLGAGRATNFVWLWVHVAETSFRRYCWPSLSHSINSVTANWGNCWQCWRFSMDKTKNWRLKPILGSVCVHLKINYAVDITKSYIEMFYFYLIFIFCNWLMFNRSLLQSKELS